MTFVAHKCGIRVVYRVELSWVWYEQQIPRVTFTGSAGYVDHT